MNEDINIKEGVNVDFSVSLVLEKLKSALSALERVVSSRSALPILNNILIRVDKNGVELSATDLEIGIKCNLTGKIDSEGVITVPGKTFISLINSLKGDTVDLKLKNNNVDVTCGDSHAVINGVSAEEFPVIPEVEGGKTVKVPVNTFRELMDAVDFSVSQEQSRPILTGVYFVSEGGKLTLAATDSYRLSEIVSEVSLGEDFSVVIPGKTLQEVKRSATGEHIHMKIGENQVMFVLENLTLVSRVIEGEYPNYKQIIPAESTTTAEFDVSEFTDALKTAVIFSTEGVNSVKITLQPDGFIEITSESSQLGNFSSKLPAAVQGEEADISFNAKYLLDGLNSFDTPSANLGITNKTSPGVFKPSGDDARVYIVMPLRA